MRLLRGKTSAKIRAKNVVLFYLKQSVKTNNQEIVMEGEQYSDTYGLNATKEEKQARHMRYTEIKISLLQHQNLFLPTKLWI